MNVDKNDSLNRVSWVFLSVHSSSALENVYSMIQHPKDAGRPESSIPGANGTMPSPRPMQSVSVQGTRAASPPCLIQRQVQSVCCDHCSISMQNILSYNSKQLQTVDSNQLVGAALYLAVTNFDLRKPGDIP